MSQTIEVPDKCFPHLVVVYIKLDPDGHEYFGFVGFFWVNLPGAEGDSRQNKTNLRSLEKLTA